MDEPTFSIGENSLQFSQPAIALPIGYAAIAGHYFRHPPRPTPYEVELAIAAVEDCIQATPALHRVSERFTCADDTLREIARIAGAEGTLTQCQLEDLFNRVADVISGSPLREGEFADDPHFYGYLIILREMAHHLGIEEIEGG